MKTNILMLAALLAALFAGAGPARAQSYALCPMLVHATDGGTALAIGCDGSLNYSSTSPSGFSVNPAGDLHIAGGLYSTAEGGLGLGCPLELLYADGGVAQTIACDGGSITTFGGPWNFTSVTNMTSLVSTGAIAVDGGAVIQNGLATDGINVSGDLAVDGGATVHETLVAGGLVSNDYVSANSEIDTPVLESPDNVPQIYLDPLGNQVPDVYMPGDLEVDGGATFAQPVTIPDGASAHQAVSLEQLQAVHTTVSGSLGSAAFAPISSMDIGTWPSASAGTVDGLSVVYSSAAASGDAEMVFQIYDATTSTTLCSITVSKGCTVGTFTASVHETSCSHAVTAGDDLRVSVINASGSVACTLSNVQVNAFIHP